MIRQYWPRGPSEDAFALAREYPPDKKRVMQEADLLTSNPAPASPAA
jgi:hypothetical protein